MTKVKICGITNKEDALEAARLGADYIGFIVEVRPSKTQISREKAKEIIKILPLEAVPVYVTHSQTTDKIIEIAKEINPEIIQLHDYISLEDIGKIRKELPKIELTKTIHVTSEKAIKEAKKYERYADFILLDTKIGKMIGGTGKTHNWEISRKIVKAVNKPVFLAGGLNPDNVKEAIGKVRPYAVDVNSGVSGKKPELKDYEKMKKLIKEAKKC